jgi:hypothetical protein
MRARALAFSKRWAGPQREESEAKTFLDEFSTIFGHDRPAPFQTDRDRVEYLFTLYEHLTAPPSPTAKKLRHKAIK